MMSRLCSAFVCCMLAVISSSSYASELLPSTGPTLLATFDADGVHVQDAGLRLLESTETPVAVIGVTGRFRSGKSFLLNTIAKLAEEGSIPSISLDQPLSSLFEVGHSVWPVTNGLYLLKLGVASDGTTLFLLDGPGLLAPVRDDQLDSDMFTLTNLLSSTLIYNSEKVIDTSSLHELARIALFSSKVAGSYIGQTESGEFDSIDDCLRGITESISADQEQIAAAAHRSDGSPLPQSTFLPKLMWVVRDATLDVEDEDHRPIHPSEWLKTILQESDRLSARRAQRLGNEVTEKSDALRLCSMFAEFHATMLPPPFETLMARGTTTLAFEEATSGLLQDLVDISQPKSIRGVAASGPTLAAMIPVWGETITNTAGFDGSLSEMIELMNSKAVNELEKSYRDGMQTFSKTFPVKHSALAQHHDALLTKFLNKLSLRAIGNAQDVLPATSKLTTSLSNSFEGVFVPQNTAAVEKTVAPVVRRLADEFLSTVTSTLPALPTAESEIESAISNHQADFQQKLATALNQYDLNTPDNSYSRDLKKHMRLTSTSLKKQNVDASKRACLDPIESFERSLSTTLTAVRSRDSGYIIVSEQVSRIRETCRGPFAPEAQALLTKKTPEWQDAVATFMENRIWLIKVGLYAVFWLAVFIPGAFYFIRNRVAAKWSFGVLAAALVLLLLYGLVMTPDVVIDFLKGVLVAPFDLLFWLYNNAVTILIISLVVTVIVLLLFIRLRMSRSTRIPPPPPRFSKYKSY